MMFVKAVLLSLLIVCCSHSIDAQDSAAELLEVDYVMYADPKFEMPPVGVKVTSEPLDLWLETLSQDNPSLQRQIADSISVASRRGMPGIERAADALAKLLMDAELDPLLRRSVAKALVALDAKQHASLIATQCNGDRAIASIAEPAFAKWKDDSLNEVWRQRLENPHTDSYSLRLAINGLGAIEDDSSGDALRKLIRSAASPPSIRLAAASALAKIQPKGLVDFSKSLTKDEPGVIAGLLAVRVLEQHVDDEAIGRLVLIAKRDEASVKSAAMRRLFEIDPQSIVPFGIAAIAHPEVNVRRIAAQALFALPSQEHIEPLSTLLSDVNPDLRRSVADMLFRLAQSDGFREDVIRQTTRVLAEDDWRGCEQATRVLVSLNHRDCGERLVALLRHPRGEAMIAAGWGLRRLESKEHLLEMLNRSNEIYRGFQGGRYNIRQNGPVDLQAQLFLAFGELRFQQADPLMRQYIPKNSMPGERDRAAACWSLGWLHEDAPDPQLVPMMISRVKDVRGIEPEMEEVRRMCAVSLGRMNAKSVLPDLRDFATGGIGAGRACHWAIERMTGEPMPPLRGMAPLDYTDWFLQPLKSDE